MLFLRRSIAAVLLCSIGACRGATVRAERPTPDANPRAAQIVADASVARARVVVTRADEISAHARDGAAITVCGALDRQGVGPRGGPSTFYLWRVLLRESPERAVYLGPVPPWPSANEGVAPTAHPSTDAASARVCVTGTFRSEYPLAPGDPPYASRFGGQWLFDVSFD